MTARRTYYLQADSEAEMKSWMSALKTAITAVRDNAHEDVVDGKPMVKILLIIIMDLVQFVLSIDLFIFLNNDIYKKKLQSKIGMDDFDLLKVIGKGSFGQVRKILLFCNVFRCMYNF